MLPALRLPLLTLAALLIPPSAALAKPLTIKAPAEAATTVTVATGVNTVTVKSAPKGVIVLGSVKRGRLAIAVARPRGAAAGNVVVTAKGKPRKVAASTACKDLAKLLARTLKGPKADGLGAVLAARACKQADPAGANELLARLGLGPALVAPGPGTTPATGGGGGGGGTLTPRGGGGGGTTPGGGGTTKPPGNPAVPAECKQSSGVGQGDDGRDLFVGINAGCGTSTKVTVEVSPAVASCQAFTAGSNWTCTVSAGKAVATGPATDLIDMSLRLTGNANCAVDAKVTLTRPGGELADLVEPIGGCGLIPVTPQCANGIDDDGDGMIDSRDGAGVTDPDPGCTGTGDDSERSEVEPPAECSLQILDLEDPKFVGIGASECGAIEGFWFKPPGSPLDCAYVIGANPATACAVTGRTIGATFAPTTDPVAFAAHLPAAPACGPVTVALILAGGAVESVRADWC